MSKTKPRETNLSLDHEKFSRYLSNALSTLLSVKEPLWVGKGAVLKPSKRASRLIKESSIALLAEYVQSPLKLIVGVSGGADSTCLLLMLALLSEFMPFEVKGAHVAYGLRGAESLDEVAYLQDLFKSLALPLNIHFLDEKETKTLQSRNLQGAARDIRLDFFKSLPCSYLCLGHTLSDNCETFLMRLLSGSGLKGLSAMSLVSDILNQGDSTKVIRPLLESSGNLLRQWLSLNSINYCNDSSNSTDKYKRNKIRHHLIPLLETIEPAAISVINQSRKLMAIDNSFLEDECTAACNRIIKDEYCRGKSLACKDLLKLHKAISSRVIRRLVEEVGASSGFSCSHTLVEEISSMARSNKATFSSSIRKHIHISLFRGRIYVFRREEQDSFLLKYKVSDECSSTDDRIFEYKASPWLIKVLLTDEKPEIDMATRSYESLHGSAMFYVEQVSEESSLLTIRSFCRGDKILCSGLTKKVSSILSEKGVPPYLRSLWPVILSGENIVWVGGFRGSNSPQVRGNSSNFILVEISPL